MHSYYRAKVEPLKTSFVRVSNKRGNCRWHFAHTVYSHLPLPADGRCRLSSTCRRTWATCTKIW